MSKKSVNQVRRKHSHEFRQNAISMIEDQGYTTTQAARELGINQNLLRTWRKNTARRPSHRRCPKMNRRSWIVCEKRTVVFVWGVTY